MSPLFTEVPAHEEKKKGETNMDKVFVVFDIETTGLYFKEHQIIEIAAIKTDLYKTYSTFQTVVALNPKRKALDPVIKQMTGLTEKDLEYGMFEVDAVEAFLTSSTVAQEQKSS